MVTKRQPPTGTVKRAYRIRKNQDELIKRYAEKIQDLSESAIVRIALDLGLAEIEVSEITQALFDGQIKVVVDEITKKEKEGERARRSKKKVAARQLTA